jgi:hypothetical protein
MPNHTFLKNATQCARITKAGTRCNSYARKGSKYCFTHDPKSAAQSALAHQKGGRAGATGHSNAKVPTKVRTIEEVLEVLDYTLSELVLMTNSILRSRGLIALAEAYLKAISVGEFETRLARLEWLSNAQPEQ